MDGDNDTDDKDDDEGFFNFHPQLNDKLMTKKKTQRSTVPDSSKFVDRNQNDDDSLGDQGADGRNLQIDQLFGRIFGIERVHILNKNDRLQDVIEKISIIPENKLVYVENTPINNGQKDNNDSDEDGNYAYQVRNILTLGDLLLYLCPSQQADP